MIAKDVDSILYNSLFVIAFFCNGDEPFDNCTNSVSSIIMFSYPYSNDYIINFIEHIKQYNYSFPLKEIVKNKISINNNIFGLIFKKN